MKISKIKKEKRDKRHRKIRSRVSGTKEIPRLSVYKSNTAVYAQIIDDENGKTLASASLNKAKDVGLDIAKKALAIKIKKVVFDRGGFIYAGKIKAIADGAREGGLKF
ncbi:MAG: 50S ribosomal protein L18 [Patescibacteria group bacterium]|nr:50S ribosomal protein L18 [Patescibacteria group bacterium]